MPEFRPVQAVEMIKEIPEEARLAAQLAAVLCINPNYPASTSSAVKEAYEIIDLTIAESEARLNRLIDKETRRRRGY